MSDAHRSQLQPWSVPQNVLILRCRLGSVCFFSVVLECECMWALGQKKTTDLRNKKHQGWNFWLYVCLFYKLPTLKDLKWCSRHGWVMNHSRRSGTVVCQDRFTRNPGTEKMPSPHKALQQETRKQVACEPQTKLCLLLFIVIIIFKFFFLWVHGWSVKGVQCKSRTWQWAQKDTCNVNFSVQEEI